jgi:tetratricopeptide (TPR) repeat protein
VVVIGIYAYTAHSGVLLSGSLSAADNHYNLLVQGFRAGQLNLKKGVPVGFAQLSDPYNPAQNARYQFAPYGMLDMSYYKGKLYIYFGVTPALALFWPYVAVTGHYLSYAAAGMIFCAIGFLTSVGLLCALWRRYFAEISVLVVAAGIVALGLATGAIIMLGRCKPNEVTISCGYAFTMLALAAIWKALHLPSRRIPWLVTASLAYGLALGARPNLLLGGVALLSPVLQAWRERQRVWKSFLAAIGPIALIGLGLMLYNQVRFDNPFEFGLRYQLAPTPQLGMRFFSLRNLWPNLSRYFLQSVPWNSRFPFVDMAGMPPFGVLIDIPFVWLALAVALERRDRSTRSCLTLFMAILAILFGLNALPLGLLAFVEGRYVVDVLPTLILLATTGVLCLERGLSEYPGWRRGARWCWSLLLAFSVVFNLLASVGACALSDFDLGVALMRRGNAREATRQFQRVLRLEAEWAEAHNDLGIALSEQGRLQEAIEQYQQALRINPDHARVHYNLGLALIQSGKTQEAITHWVQALRLEPDYTDAHYNLGLVLQKLGRTHEAIDHFEQALRIEPHHALAHNSLGATLLEQGKLQEAIDHYEQALQIQPNFAEAHYNLGVALEQAGRRQDAVQHYEQALHIQPDFVQAQNALARARTVQSASTPTAEKSR